MRSAYSYNEQVIAVESDREADLSWLEENLLPAFSAASPLDADVEIHCRREPAEFGFLGELFAGAAESPVFSMDGHAQHCAVVREPAGDQLVWDPELLCFYRLRADGRHIELVAECWRASQRIALLRLMREIAGQRDLAGGIGLHAASLEADGRGILLAGARRAGKTTLLAQFLTDGAHYLGNDRALISPAAEGFELRGMPTIVSVRPHTLTLLPALKTALTGAWFARQTLAEVQANAVTENPAQAASISPAQFCQLLDCQAIARSGLSWLLFPQVSEARKGITYETLSREEALSALADNVFHLSATLFGPGDDGSFRQRLQAVAEAIPASRVYLGQGAEQCSPLAAAPWRACEDA